MDDELRELEHRAARLGYVLVKEEEVNHDKLLGKLAARRYPGIGDKVAQNLVYSELAAVASGSHAAVNKNFLTETYKMQDGDTLRPLAPYGGAAFRMHFNGASIFFSHSAWRGPIWEMQFKDTIYTDPQLEPLLEQTRCRL